MIGLAKPPTLCPYFRYGKGVKGCMFKTGRQGNQGPDLPNIIQRMRYLCSLSGSYPWQCSTVVRLWK